jgi:hypothetical protein
MDRENLEWHRKTDAIISKFKNGKELYRKSAMFNQCVQMLVRDADPLEIIEMICQSSDDIVKALEYRINNEIVPIGVMSVRTKI